MKVGKRWKTNFCLGWYVFKRLWTWEVCFGSTGTRSLLALLSLMRLSCWMPKLTVLHVQITVLACFIRVHPWVLAPFTLQKNLCSYKYYLTIYVIQLRITHIRPKCTKSTSGEVKRAGLAVEPQEICLQKCACRNVLHIWLQITNDNIYIYIYVCVCVLKIFHNLLDLQNDMPHICTASIPFPLARTAPVTRSEVWVTVTAFVAKWLCVSLPS